MWNIPSKKRLNKIPRLYETENIPLAEKRLYLHFFICGCDWYVAEYDGVDLFWGFACLNGDVEMAEWGYFSFSELKSINIKGLETDCELENFWGEYVKAKNIELIREAGKL
jgi:hypothetical protein